MPLPDFPPADFQPRYLSKEEILTPTMVLAAFFDFAHLPQIREIMREMLTTIVTGNWHLLNSSNRNDMLYFYEKLEKLIEAAHLIFKASSVAGK